MAWSRAGANAARVARRRVDMAEIAGDARMLECGHETSDAPIVRFQDGRLRFACSMCGGVIRKEKGSR